MSEPTTESFRQLITGWIFAPTHTIYGKRHASFADMLATLRCDSLQKTRETIFSAAGLPPASRN